MTKPDRHTKINRKGVHVTYTRIVKLLRTDVEGVKTAVLDCGERLRYDVNHRRSKQKYMICPKCTAEMEAARQEKKAQGVIS